jgi:hypothetical protein
LLALAVRKRFERALATLLAAEFFGVLAALSLRGTLLARGNTGLGVHRSVTTFAPGVLSGRVLAMAFGQDPVA